MGGANERERDDEITELPTHCRPAARSIDPAARSIDLAGSPRMRDGHVSLT